MAIAVASTSVGNSGGVTTAHTITLPSGNQAGDLVLVFFSNDNADTATPPAGWSTVFSTQNTGKSTLSVFSRILPAPLSSIVVNTGSAQGSCHACYRVTGHDPSTAVQLATATIGNTPEPDPPLLNPAAWDTGSALWIAVAGWDNPRSCTAFSMLGNQVSTFLNLTAGCGIAVSSELLSNSEYDPFPYTISRREGWITNTLAIRQAQPSATITQTLPSLTQSGEAGVLSEATATQSLRPVGQSGTAGVLAEVSVEQTLPALTQEAVANIRIALVVLNQTLPAITQSAVLESSTQLTGAQSLPVISQTAEATVDIQALITQDLPALTQSSTVDSGTTVDAIQDLPAMTQSAEAFSVIDALLIQRLPAMTQSSEIAVDCDAEILQTLPVIAQSGSANLDDGSREVTASQALPALLQGATTEVGVTAAITQTLPKLGQAVAASTGSNASIVQRLSAISQSAELRTGMLAEIIQLLPGIVQYGEIQNDTPPPQPRKKTDGTVVASTEEATVFSRRNKKLVVSSTPRKQGVRSR